MSDLHQLPLRGHDLPEFSPRALRERAHVYAAPEGWRWEHQCSDGWWRTSQSPYPSLAIAYDAAARHLEVCCHG